MKHFILILIFTNSFTGWCQEIHGDSLQKYSYTVIGFNGTPNSMFGTCFFTKDSQYVYFITAKHNFYNCDPSSNKIRRRFNQAIVMLPDYTSLPIQIPDANRKDTCLSMDRDTDLLVVRIEKKWEKSLNTVEKFMLPVFQKIGDIEIFGQGMRADSIVAVENQHHIHIDKETFTIYSDAPTDDKTYIDTVHSFVELKNIKTGRWLKGFSGSPVFLQDSKTKKWRVCGVFIIVYENELLPKDIKGAFEMIKPEYITKAISELK